MYAIVKRITITMGSMISENVTKELLGGVTQSFPFVTGDHGPRQPTVANPRVLVCT